MNILDKILKKRGIKDVKELDGEELAQFEEWRKTLTEDEITLDSFKQFCEQAITIIEGKFKDLDNSEEKYSRLVLQYNIYTSIVHLFDSPQQTKEHLIKYLTGLLEEK